jgi:hypothetical protein
MTHPGPSREWLRSKLQEYDAILASYREHNPFTVRPGGVIEFDGEIPSNTRKGVTYHVTVKPDQRATCTCDGFTKWGRGKDCSHIRAVKKALEQG